ncbi:MAG: hypothetical protein B7Z66_15860 [Chromatiales bacterium 21-64-14]|nr:MAG: hypothetical protein B7Z66_15860 [Chromatiales bacterium 21-64-14]
MRAMHCSGSTFTLEQPHLCASFNATDVAVPFRLPRATGPWRLYIDTAAASPKDIRLVPADPPLSSDTLVVASRSLAVLLTAASLLGS